MYQHVVARIRGNFQFMSGAYAGPYLTGLHMTNTYELSRRTRTVVAALILCGALLATLARPAHAGVPATMQATPTTLAAGASIGITVNACIYDGIEVELTAGWENSTAIPKTDPIASTSLASGDSGWSGSLTVPASAAPGVYTLRGVCHGENGSFAYDNIEITVTPGPTTTSSPTTMTTTTTSPASTKSPTAPVAPTVVAKPTYTG